MVFALSHLLHFGLAKKIPFVTEVPFIGLPPFPDYALVAIASHPCKPDRPPLSGPAGMLV
jgi:hypothetical protein